MAEKRRAVAALTVLWVAVMLAQRLPAGGAWQLAHCGLNESYRVLHLSTHFGRVFLSIAVESRTFPTLIETQWPESYLPTMPPILYPHRSLHANGNHTDCSRIQQARWSQADSLSRLWVMDMGWAADRADSDLASCPPKLLVFDLLRNDIEVLRIDCGKYIQPKDTHQLDVKLGPRLTSCSAEKFIYFVVADEPHVLAYDILEQRWHRRQLWSRKYNGIAQHLPIRPREITFGRHGDLLISDEDGQLFSAANALHEATTTIEMTLLGSLLGATRGLMADRWGVLFYAVPRFGAVVRCAYKANLTAEDNEIIFMTPHNIQQIFFDDEGSVWLLSDRWLKPSDRCFGL